MENSLVFSLAKVIAATAWVDGEVTLDEINCMKDLLFQLPDLTARDWERLEMYLQTPVGDAEREGWIADLRSMVKTEEDRRLVKQSLETLIQADGDLTAQERAVVDEVIRDAGSAEKGFFGKMSGLLKPSLNRRATTVAAAPNREQYFDDYVNNRVYYEIRQKMAAEEVVFELTDAELKRLSLAGGILSIVARVDRSVSEDEVRTIAEAVRRGWGLPDDKAEVVAAVAVSELNEDLDPLRLYWNFFEVTSEEERLRFLNALFAVAAADGKVTNVESEEIRQISISLKMSHSQYIDAKMTVPKDLLEL